MGTSILFWNCQGIRPQCKELELYLKENLIDVIALNEKFLSKKHNFKIPGYDTIRNDRSTGQRGGFAFLVKNGPGVNKECWNDDFNIITDNEALAIELELSDNQSLNLATIYCPNGNPNLLLFQTINNLSNNVMFVGDFNSKLESFGCTKENISNSMLKNIQKQLNLIYLMMSTRIWTDLLDMAFISPNLAKHDIEFQIVDDLGSDHLAIEISINAPPQRYSSTGTPSTNLTRLAEKYSNQHSRLR